MQRVFAEDDDVIQTFTANRSNEPFDICSLPRRSRRREHLFDAHRLHLIDEGLPEDLVTITQQIARRTVSRKGLSELLGCPFRRRMSSHAEVENTPPIISKHQEYA